MQPVGQAQRATIGYLVYKLAHSYLFVINMIKSLNDGAASSVKMAAVGQNNEKTKVT